MNSPWSADAAGALGLLIRVEIYRAAIVGLFWWKKCVEEREKDFKRVLNLEGDRFHTDIQVLNNIYLLPPNYLISRSIQLDIPSANLQRLSINSTNQPCVNKLASLSSDSDDESLRWNNEAPLLNSAGRFVNWSCGRLLQPAPIRLLGRRFNSPPPHLLHHRHRPAPRHCNDGSSTTSKWYPPILGRSWSSTTLPHWPISTSITCTLPTIVMITSTLERMENGPMRWRGSIGGLLPFGLVTAMIMMIVIKLVMIPTIYFRHR